MNPQPQGAIGTSTSALACVAAGPPIPPTFQVETTLQLQANFFAPGGVTPADPTVVTLLVQAPDGTITTYTDVSTPAIVKVSTGVYTFDFTPNASGAWVYKWQGTAPVEITSPDVSFTVQPSALIAG